MSDSEAARERINSLVTRAVRESPQLDFKEGRPDRWHALDRNDERRKKRQREFLKDLAGMANGRGGTIYYGIREDGDAVAEEVRPFSWERPDNAQRALVDLARTHIDPPLNIRLELVDMTEKGDRSKYVLAIHVPEAWGMPHMVSYDNNTLFYRRRETSVPLMDIHEIREAFMKGPELAERLRAWRAGRIDHVRSGLSPTGEVGSFTAFHVVPLRDWSLDRTHDVRQFVRNDLRPFDYQRGAHGVRWNLDGFALQPSGEAEHVQVTRTGALEAVTSHVFETKDGTFLSVPAIANRLVRWLPGARNFLDNNDFTGPFALMLTLVGVENLTPWFSDRILTRSPKKPIRRREIWFPDVVVHEFEDSVVDDLSQLLHVLWQTFGHAECPAAVMEKLANLK